MIAPKTLIAKRLKDAMDERGINAAELARIADVKKTFLYDVLSGKSLHPSSVTLSKVAEVFGLPVTYFAGTATATPTAQAGAHSPYVILPALQGAMDEMSFRRSWLKATFQTEVEALKVARIKGDGMSPSLLDGDVVMLDTSDRVPHIPGVYMLAQGRMVQPKRLEMFKKQVQVSSDNAAYKAFVTGLDELDIVGRVVWVSRAL